MDEPRLHPRLAAHLGAQGWEGLTPAQSHALDPLLAGRHTLLVAPTGYGKTEAALLPVLSRILAERDRLLAARRPWPAGFKALYVTPLRALNRDLLQRLTEWASALDLGIAVRHGDTTQAERARQARRPPDLLITTPETVQLLLYGDTLRRHLRTVRFVVLDEVHELAASERGAQLAVALERIEELLAQPETVALAPARERVAPEAPTAPVARGPASAATGPAMDTDAAVHTVPSGFQRIGLSATVADPAAVAAFLGGPRPVEVVQVAAPKRLVLHVTLPEVTDEDRRRSATLALPPNVVAELRTVRDLVRAHQRVLVFHNTRDGAELLASRSALLDEEDGAPPLLGLHHGSLSTEHRQDMEDRFKRGDLRALVATSSLELGIDVGAIDHVVQVHSPRSVARLVQRLGRAGHRVGAVSEGTLVAAGPEDVLECMAVARAAAEGRLEPVVSRPAPLVVLANQLVALTNEYADFGREWTWQLVRRAAPFLDLEEGLFEAVWEALLELRTLYPADDDPRRFSRSGRARRHFLDHIGLIPDERSYRIVDESTKRSIGSVDDAFVAAALRPGTLFVMAGRSWRVLEVEVEAQRVRVGPAKEIGAVPQWTGSQLPVSLQVAQEVARLRGLVARQDRKAPAGSGADDVLAAYPADERALAAAAAPVQEQVRAGLAVPTDTLVTLETGRALRVAHTALGTRGNEALGRITQALLHQRIGAPVGMESDAYRIHFTAVHDVSTRDIEEMWRSLDPDTLDLLVAAVLRDSPALRHHLVHVAKHFGALPKALDPNRFSRAKLESLLDRIALHEESMARLVHERFDLAAVAGFLRDLAADRVRVVHQAVGPLARMGQDQARSMLASPRTDEALLAAVRERIEASDVLLVCTNCRHHWPAVVRDIPAQVRCRRCGANQVACLRPWNEDLLPLLGDATAFSDGDRLERARLIRNAQIVASFGATACRALVGRGVGPDTAARILQKARDTEDPAFWREILLAELHFARTNVYWRR